MAETITIAADDLLDSFKDQIRQTQGDLVTNQGVLLDTIFLYNLYQTHKSCEACVLDALKPSILKYTKVRYTKTDGNITDVTLVTTLGCTKQVYTVS